MEASKQKTFAEDGAVLIEGFLNSEQLARCRAASTGASRIPVLSPSTFFPGPKTETHNDNANPRAARTAERIGFVYSVRRIVRRSSGAQKEVWYFAEEVFLKSNGKGGRTPWHQDTSYLPWDGMHWANAWISFEAVPKA